ncbi:pyruvate kinase PyK1 [Cardiosporidium cionae]|uniref:Pyruvate kinase n=1 Tax=Cardiosporidium cionae TaxID=476202 RepID=A0ABQ7J4E9_9APIC|nr:pyruvate kinase PyK1 [Cardiosporidium cionae]|eukprot:KAF8817953.1 pyruvate kinase PyK1 [Cardiosporidium cionae]
MSELTPSAHSPESGKSSRIQRLISNSTIMVQSLGKATNIGIPQIMAQRSTDDLLGRRTRIVCTMGPSCADVETLSKMVVAGLNVCRLNFSHGNHESHGNVVKNIIEVQKRFPSKRLAIMLDTKGPEIRTGFLKNHGTITLQAGQTLKITTDYEFLGDSECISCSYKALPQSVHKGNTILIADGLLGAEVLECGVDSITVLVKNSCVLGERKNMNLPNVKVQLPCIGEKDADDILNFGIPMGCNFIAASFVQSAEDVCFIRNLLGPKGRHIKIIPKIENMEGLLNFNEILAEADGIMVARGDLGMEIPAEKVFLAQKMMIAKCNVAGKPVITATQMLESMTKNPRSTRAEAADVANAVLDGTDCVMLSGETASGLFPVEAVSVMAKICLEAEACIDYSQLYTAMVKAVPTPISTQEAVARAAVETAESINAALILALTETGYTAHLIAKYRPQQWIFALSASEYTVRNLVLHRGIFTYQVPSFQGTDHVIRNALEAAKALELVVPGDSVVAVHGIKEEIAGSSNLLKVVVVT